MNISKDTPLSELTLRRYEKPSNLKKRELVRKFCLSIGLLQPGDSRDVVVDILYILLEAKKQKQELNSDQIKQKVVELRRQESLELLGIASSNIRRQLKRLRDLFLAEKVKNNYRITEFESMTTIFKEKIERFLLQSITERVSDYFKRLEEEF